MESLVHCRINVQITDMNRSVEFYCDLLGLELVNRYGNHYAEVKGPDLLIGLHPSSNEIKVGNNMSIGFGVTQFDETVKQLEAKGLEIRVDTQDWIQLAYFKDPDNNNLYLAENKL